MDPLATQVGAQSGYEAAALRAFRDQEYAEAAEHCLCASAAAFSLARESVGETRQQRCREGYDLLDLAEELIEQSRREQSRREQSRRRVPAEEGKTAEETPDRDTRWNLTERPDVRLADVAGLAAVKDEIRRKITEPFDHPEIYAEFRARKGGGVLMYGPPGNGKTLIAKAIAGELDAPFFNVDLSRMKSKWVGETAKNMSALFAEARKHPRAVVFLDEVDSLLARRGNRHVDAVAQFLTLADGIDGGEGHVLLLAGTNRPWAIDPAVMRPGRLGTHLYVGLPDIEARRGILAVHLAGVPVAASVDLDAIATRTQGFSGAEIRELVERAKAPAIQREIDRQQSLGNDCGEKERVSPEDFERVVTQLRPATDAGVLAQFEDWNREREAG